MSDFPERIWLQSEMEGFNVETTWCIDQINDDDAEYIRVDLSDKQSMKADILAMLNTCLDRDPTLQKLVKQIEDMS